MAPITRTIELYRRDTTSGNTVLVDTNGRLDVIKVAGTTQTAGDLAALVNAVDDYVDTEVAAIKAKTDLIPASPAQAGEYTSTLSTIAGYIDTEVAAIKAKTDNLPSDPADASDIAASFTTVNGTLATIAGYIDTEVAAIYSRIGAPVGASISADIAGISAGSGPSAATIADAVWDEILSGHAGVGSTGAALAAAGGSGDPWATALPGAYGSGTAGKIIGDNINATISSRSTQTSVDTIDDFVDTEVAAIKAKTDNLPADPASAATIATAFGVTNGKVDTVATYIDTEVAAIKAKTDNLPADPASAATLAGRFNTVDSNIATVAGYIDTEVAAIKAKTDNLPASPAATSDIPTANANADALLDRANGIETGYTLRQTIRLMSAVLAGKSTGHPGSPVYRNMPDTADRVTATVSSGNRSAVTLNP